MVEPVADNKRAASTQNDNGQEEYCPPCPNAVGVIKVDVGYQLPDKVGMLPRQ
ncbi:hypothetical protein [Phytohalomonas tamaricis]|uniref:hypothetical protein n=1 Tax=Phytohalomonas tamaricis TaxID=2081032 RepID=UPI001319E66A|nr:hypothetical protein [Phytohalomonas tamaricis]